MQSSFFSRINYSIINYFVLFLLCSVNSKSNTCPDKYRYTGKCVNGKCSPRQCPAVCRCIKGACCSSAPEHLVKAGNRSRDNDLGTDSVALIKKLLSALAPHNSYIGCEDAAINCRLYKDLCHVTIYSQCMEDNCAYTCKKCDGSGQSNNIELLSKMINKLASEENITEE